MITYAEENNNTININGWTLPKMITVDNMSILAVHNKKDPHEIMFILQREDGSVMYIFTIDTKDNELIIKGKKRIKLQECDLTEEIILHLSEILQKKKYLLELLNYLQEFNLLNKEINHSKILFDTIPDNHILLKYKYKEYDDLFEYIISDGVNSLTFVFYRGIAHIRLSEYFYSIKSINWEQILALLEDPSFSTLENINILDENIIIQTDSSNFQDASVESGKFTYNNTEYIVCQEDAETIAAYSENGEKFPIQISLKLNYSYILLNNKVVEVSEIHHFSHQDLCDLANKYSNINV